MATEKWTLYWEAAQTDDGTWKLFRVDPTTHKILQDVASAWISVEPDAINVDMEILAVPPIPPPYTRPDGALVTQKPFDFGSVRLLVTDLILYDLLHPELQGRAFATLTFFEKQTGAVVKQYKNRKY